MAHPKLCFILMTTVISMLATNASAAPANEETGELQRQLTELAQQMLQMQQGYQQQIVSLEQRMGDLEKQSGQIDRQLPATVATDGAGSGNSALQLGLSGLFAGGGSSVNNDDLQGLQAGAHDPNRNGFTVQNVEMSLGAAVDPYFDAQANIIFQIDSNGDTVVELEEAYFTTRSLPGGMQVKGGQFFTEFGRLNKQHPHSWSFVDQPIILSRFFGGDGLRSQGARLSWLTPTDWYSEIIIGMQNAKGETVTSFLNAPGEDVGGHALADRDARDFGDLLYSARWLNGFDLSDTVSMNLGVSGLWGPNASGGNTDTSIVGTDWYVKWRPARTQRGFPFVSWHTEALWRRYEAGGKGTLNQETLKDWGLFTQAMWGFRPGWVAGLRWEYATADGDTATDPFRDTRKRLSPNLTWYPTEYSKLRLQYNRDWSEHLADKSADTLWLQAEFNIGSHAAHVF